MKNIANRKKIRKAIIPVAGMGTRFLPATKAQPKEMLSVVDKPVIQYIVEEAVSAGIEEIIFVTAIGKRAIEDHFDRNFELEYRLEQKNKVAELKMINDLSNLAKFAFVRQQKPLGDGHAILAAAHFMGDDESVAVLFGDDIVKSGKPAIGQLIEIFDKYGDPVVALEKIPKQNVSKYGIIDGIKLDKKVWEIKDFVEKPKVGEAPSDLAAVGRYIITPEIIKDLEKQKPDKDGEIRLANALSSRLSQDKPVYGCQFEGKRYDCGDKLQFVIAQIEMGLEHPEMNEGLRDYLEKQYKSSGRI